MLLGCVNVGFLCSAASVVRRTGAVPTDAAVLEPFALPLVRGSVLGVYAFSVLHKLNAGFLDPGTSCAVELYRTLAQRLPIPDGGWVAKPAIYGTLASEVAIPLLLISRRLRTAGLVGGLLFHYVLGLADFFNFSLVMVALYAAFLPPGFGRHLAAAWARLGRGRSIAWGGALLGAWLLLALALAATLAARGRELDLPRLAHAGGYALWILYGPLVGVGYSVVIARSAERPRHGSLRLAPRRRWHAVAVGLILLNGVAPYFGLKTEAAFSMYSNLRTEGPHWNHLVLPAWLKVAPYQDDLVSIHASSEPALRQYGERGDRLVGVEFERIVGRLCQDRGRAVAVEYTRGGERRAAPDACGSRPDPDRAGGWASRLLVFRPVGAGCRH
jgi:hypothetical protein